ncbi:hypothetical protein IQ216_10445, partial [Cyanobium sp. LEGE 06143]|nr:hypothetical protein [Cyanobium sp. LEGE 06143]
VLPGEGGYRLHAHRLWLPLPGGQVLALEAPLPPPLLGSADGACDSDADPMSG